MHSARRGIAFFGTAAFITAFFALSADVARAGLDDLWRGAVWSPNAGWIIMNCRDDSSVPDACSINDYGVDLDKLAGPPRPISGWAWSANAGWVCFGSACAGITGNTPEGGAPYAELDIVTDQVHGWANIVNLDDFGWVSLNCADVGACGSSDYKVTIDILEGDVNGFAWNGNSDGSGYGWIDFSPSYLPKDEICDNGLDDDLDTLIDCADPDCLGKPGPPCVSGPYNCGPENSLDTCNDLCDNDGDLDTDCADPTSCTGEAAFGCPATEDACLFNQPCCANNLDDDFDGKRDCADDDCFGVDGCPSTEPFIPTLGCTGDDPYECCSDNIDGDGDSYLDCFDADCDEYCTGFCENSPSQKCIYDFQCPISPLPQKCNIPIFPWLQTLLGDIYSSEEITADKPPPRQPTQQYNATYCLLTGLGLVTNFIADPSGLCGIQTVTPVNAPAGSSGYKTEFGRIDVAGILAGRYGQVVTVTDGSFLSSTLNGQVFVSSGDLVISSGVTIPNAAGNTSGAGLVVVQGDLTIQQDISYSPDPITNLKNLASVGYLVLGDDINIDPNVEKVAGIFFVEGNFNSGTSDKQLTVYGPVVAKSFNFNRDYTDAEIGSELVIYDGRYLLNPPPGLTDFAKALPSINVTTPLSF